MTTTERQIFDLCSTRWPDRQPIDKLRKLKEEVIELYDAASRDDHGAVAAEAADIVVVLTDLLALTGFSLHEETGRAVARLYRRAARAGQGKVERPEYGRAMWWGEAQ